MLYTVSQTRLGADCSSYHELLIAKFRHKLKKAEKTTKPFSYDLSQISYDYTVEGMNRFKRLELVDRLPIEVWMEVHNIVQKEVIKIIQRKRSAIRQNGCLRKPYKHLRNEENQKIWRKGNICN